MAFARTLTGREVMINLPEYSFTVEPIVIVPPAPTPQELEQIRLAKEEAARLAQEKQDKALMKKALAINGFVLFAGVVIMVAIRLWLNYQARPKPELESETDTLQLDDGDLELDNTLNFKDKVLLKIKFLIPGKKNTKLKTEEPALEGLD